MYQWVNLVQNKVSMRKKQYREFPFQFDQHSEHLFLTSVVINLNVTIKYLKTNKAE